MVKIMRPVQNLSLRKSLVLYIVLFVMFALALSIMTASVCETVADKINEKYPNTGEKYYLTNEQGERLGEGTYIYKELPVLNEQDEQLLAILDLLPTVTPPIYSAFCIIAAALYLMDYAKKNNIEIAGIYLDVGYHGRTMDRPGLQSVIQTLKEGNADVILVANYNRLYRGRFPQELQELPVVSLKEQNRKRERGGKEHDI